MSNASATLSTVNFEASDAFEVLERSADAPHEYDALVFGIVAMDLEGVVWAYNRAEALYSGIPLARVLQANFFNDVAPCTNNYMVAGRFEEAVELDETIDYVFTLKMRPTRVRLRMLKQPWSPRQYLLIERV